MARIASVMAGLACALAICFAVPIASAAPTDHLLFDSGPGLEPVAAPTAFDLVAIDAHDEVAVPMFAAAADDVEAVNCSDGPAWGAVQIPMGGHAAERPPACNTDRRHDPGWQLG